MIIGLDSAIPPNAAQAEAAKTAGIGSWNGYLSEIPQRDGLYRPWLRAEFDVVRVVNPKPIAFTSGWDDPVGGKQMAQDWNVRLCLDVERLIRDDGPWVQAWLDASGAGLYGVHSVHVGRRAAFHIAAWYPGYNPAASYPTNWDSAAWAGAAPHGWQWQNTHTEFGVGVDRGWYDDFFGGNNMASIDDVLAYLKDVNTQTLGRLEGEIKAINAETLARLEGEIKALQATVNTLKAAPPGAIDLQPVLDAIHSLKLSAS